MSTISNVKKSFLFFPVVSLILLITSCVNENIPLYSLGSGGGAGNYLDVGMALTRVVNKNQVINGFQLEEIISSGSVSNIDEIAAGNIQFGIAQADHQYQAVNGLGEWKDKGSQENLRAVFNLFSEAVTLVAGVDSGIRSINDLKGKHVDIGSPGSGSRQNAIDALRAAGIDWNKDIQAHEESLDDRLSMFMRGELDAFFFTVSHPNKEIKFATFSVRGARIIPLTNIDSVMAANPYYSRVSIPATLYPMLKSQVDIETIEVNAALLTSVNVSEDVVYAFTKTVFENLDALTKYNPELNGLRNNKFLEGLTAPIHPGALKYYQEVGLHIP